jgi:hypothetical protein
VLRLVFQEATPIEPGGMAEPGVRPLRDTAYATELAHGRFRFPSGTEGRIERLRFKAGTDAGQEGIRFSWWKDGRMVPRPLDATEDQLLALLVDSVQEGVFSKPFLRALRQLLVQVPDG